MIHETVMTFVGNGGAGFLAGFAMGKFLRFIAKIVILAGGAIATLLMVLDYYGIISVNWKVVNTVAATAANQASSQIDLMLQHVNAIMGLSTSAIAVGFLGGVAIGALRK